MDHGLWLLANQLYRPTCKSITPAFSFGFAVDGGSNIVESVFTYLWSIPKKGHSGQTGAAIEGVCPDAGNTIRNSDTGQAAAVSEGPIPEVGNAIRYHDARQVAAEREGSLTDTGDTVGDRDACQAVAENEGRIPDAGDRFAFNTRRNG